MLLTGLVKTLAQGSPCCLTSSLVINSGYNPVTGSVIPSGTPGFPVTDPHWTVTYLSPDNIAYFPGVTGFALPSIPYPAYVAPSSGYPVYAGCNWLAIANQTTYPTVSGATYDAVFTRTFTTCTSDCYNFNLNLSFDYNVVSVKIDGVPQAWSSWFCSGCVVSATYSSVCLPAGTHTIDIELMNDAWGVLLNGYALDVYGTVTSAGGNSTIVSEGAGCTAWSYCTEPPVTGPTSVCIGSNITLADAEPGGTWSCFPIAVATINPSTGVLTGGLIAGTAAVTYTDPCGRSVFYNVTVVACAPTVPCCLTKSLKINTSYDPMSGTVIAPGTPLSPVTDPHWTVTYLSPDNAAYFPGVTGFPLPLLPYPAYVVPSPGYPVYPGCGWLSIANQITFPTLSGRYYDAVFTRSFTTCTADCFDFNLNLAFDYNVLSVKIDGVPQPWGSGFCSGCIVPASYLGYCLPAGTHYLSVELVNDAWTYPTNGYALDVFGTITSSTGSNSLVSEGKGCSGWSYCTEAPITGPTTVCEGSSIVLNDVEGGGTWTSAPPAVGSIDPVTGVFTGTAGGVATITYTDLCGRDVYYTVTVVPEPVVCVTTGYTLDYWFHFTSTSGTAIIEYAAVGIGGVPMCTGYLAPAGATVPYGAISMSCPGYVGVCITGVYDGGCYWPLTGAAACCTYVNHLKPGRNGTASVTPAETGDATISVIPNPNTGAFTLSGSMLSSAASTEVKIEVLDVTGKVVFSDAATVDQGTMNKKIALDPSVANGVYLIKVKNADVNKVLRFTLNR